MKRTARLYLLIVSIVGCGIFFILQLGSQLPQPVYPPSTEPGAVTSSYSTDVSNSSFFASVESNFRPNATYPLSRLFLQLLIVIGASGVVAWIFTRCGQPAVIGEMVAGILLGPSLFGLLAPNAFQFIFAASSLDALRLLSQIGICLFLFAVGMELDMSEVRHKAQTAVVVSHSSIVIPYFLGVTLALFLYSHLAQPGVSFLAFALFMGISMSITAFPVLVRILQDRGIFKTSLGSTATACAAVDDVTAWSMLAFVVAIARATSVGGAAFNLGLVVVYIALMLFVIKPKLPDWIGQSALARPDPSKVVLAVVFVVVIVSALTTELIGIHALFGAFLAGIVMPTAGGFRDKLVVRVENFKFRSALAGFLRFQRSAHPNWSPQRRPGLAHLPSDYHGSHYRKTWWKRSSCPFYRD